MLIKKIFFLFLMLYAVSFECYCQKISKYFNCDSILGNIELNRSLNIKEIKKLGKYKKEIKLNWFDNRPYKFRFYFFGDTLYIAQDKEYKFSFKYYTSEVVFFYPAKTTTTKGIKIGKSTRQDVVAAYGKPDLEAPFTYDYYFPNYEYLTFVFYEKKETDEDYNPELKGKVVSIILQ